MRGGFLFFCCWLAVMVEASITRSQLDDAKRACRAECVPKAEAAECIKKCWKDYFATNKHLGGAAPLTLTAASSKRTSSAGRIVAAGGAWMSALVLLGLVLVYN